MRAKIVEHIKKKAGDMTFDAIVEYEKYKVAVRTYRYKDASRHSIKCADLLAKAISLAGIAAIASN